MIPSMNTISAGQVLGSAVTGGTYIASSTPALTTLPTTMQTFAQPMSLVSQPMSVAQPVAAPVFVSQPMTTYAAPVEVIAAAPMQFEYRNLAEDRIRRVPAVYKGEAPNYEAVARTAPQEAAPQVLGDLCLRNVFYEDPSQCPAQGFCASPDEITAEWLSAAVNAPVVSFNTEVCQQGQCALTVLIKNVQYAEPCERPASYALKMHGQTDEQRLMFSGLGHFTREVFFYTQFADQVPLASPPVFGAWTDANGVNLTDAAAPPVEYFNLLMMDMNDGYRGFDPVMDGAHTSLQETEEALMLAREMHVAFFNQEVLTMAPFSKTGADFTLDAKRPYVGYAVASWPPVRDNMPALSGWDKFPDHALDLVDFYDTYLADGGRLANQFIDALEKVFRSRPMTLNHGDFNCGNVWQSTANPQEYVFADWQMYERAPIGLDIESMLVTLGNGPDVTTLMDKYWAGLPQDIQAAYSREALQDDFKGQLVVVSFIIIAIMAGQLDPSSMPQEKFWFCWNILWPKAFKNFGTLFRDLQVPAFAASLMQ